MSKNILLFADGTGNKGGSTPDSNVYKLYRSIDLHDENLEQIVFYDNGVGTQTNNYIRGLSAALGFGFQNNVCDLYEYLARHYDPGDSIYMFGFSRGAATICAFNGFIDSCGLIDGRGKGNSELKAEVHSAIKAYKKPAQHAAHLKDITLHENKPNITFIGVWDTVSALGFPERTDTVTPLLTVLNVAFRVMAAIADKLIPHKYYNYELTPNITTARQALAIDDERTSFWPKVWKEDTKEAAKVDSIRQVWFTGMHSNVGGGYERAGLANASYHWMLSQLSGIKFKSNILDKAAADANVNGRMYNSRHGLASFYRYHPRMIGELCKEAGVEVQIHESVLRRLRLRTANYAPRMLPESFTVVDNADNTEPSPSVYSGHWQLFKSQLNRTIFLRKVLYGIQLDIVLLILSLAAILKFTDLLNLPAKTPSDFQLSLVNALEFISPDVFDDVIQLIVVTYPLLGACIATIIILFLIVRGKARKITSKFAERLRKLIIHPGEPHPKFP